MICFPCFDEIPLYSVKWGEKELLLVGTLLNGTLLTAEQYRGAERGNVGKITYEGTIEKRGKVIGCRSEITIVRKIPEGEIEVPLSIIITRIANRYPA